MFIAVVAEVKVMFMGLSPIVARGGGSLGVVVAQNTLPKQAREQLQQAAQYSVTRPNDNPNPAQ